MPIAIHAENHRRGQPKCLISVRIGIGIEMFHTCMLQLYQKFVTFPLITYEFQYQ